MFWRFPVRWGESRGVGRNFAWEAVNFAMRMWILGVLLLLFGTALPGQDFNWSVDTVEEVIIPADLPMGDRYKGLFRMGLTWEYRTGRHYLILSELWNRKHTENTLYITRYVTLKST